MASKHGAISRVASITDMAPQTGESGAAGNGIRKQDHLRIALNERVDFTAVSTGLEQYHFVHQALPELSLKDVDTSLTLFGRRLSAPVIISPMVGGISAAASINRNLAEAAQSLGLAMGLGSQRCVLDDPSLEATYRVRHVAPDILLFANIGAVQLNYGYGVNECARAVQMVGADALVLHLNPLQEALQPEGNTDFSGLAAHIEEVCRELTVPVVVKEVGWGISEETARTLSSLGVTGIDVAGAGGTSWGKVESYRARTSMAARIARTFSSWGIPTAESIQMVRRGAQGIVLVASGGIRTGLDAAKAIALGADACGIASPLLKAARNSVDEVAGMLRQVIDELRLAMFCAGAPDLASLKTKPLLKRSGGR